MPPAGRVYRALLIVAPRPLRRKHGAEMEALFVEALDAARSRGPAAVASVWVRGIADLLAARARTALAPRQSGSIRTGGRTMLRSLGRETSDAVRSLTRRPLFTVLTALTLAAGLGFNTALFAIVYAVMLRPLPFPEPDRLAMIWTGRGDDGRGFVNSAPDYVDWRARAKSFSGLAVYNITWTTLAERSEPEQVDGAVVSANFFDVLRARFQLGTGFDAGDDVRGAEAVVVLTDSLWRRQYGADRSIVGRTVRIDQRSRRVVGVLAPDFMHPEPFATAPAEYFQPFVLNPEQYGRGFRWVRVVGRLADGVTLETARAEMSTIAADLAKSYPGTNNGQIVVGPLHGELIGDIRPMLLALVAIVGTVLVLACANVVNTLLAQASRRATEFAVRNALGASRARIIRQLVIESLLLGIAGGAVGLLLVLVGLRALLDAAPDLPRIQSVGITSQVLLFAFGMALIAGAACGLVPAWQVARARYAPGLMRGTRGSSGLEATRRRTVLIAIEVALAFPLTVGAALLTQTLVQLRGVEKGFDDASVVQARITLEGDRYRTGEQSKAFFDALLARLRETPGITSAGMTSSLPLSGINVTGGSVTGERQDGSLAETFAGHRYVSAGYFETLGVELVHGRTFDGSAADRTSAVVSDRLAAALWPDHDPIGQRVRQGSKESTKLQWFTVIGVVKAIRQTGLEEEAQPELFQPYSSNPWRTMTVAARTAGDPRIALQPFKAAVRSLDPGLAVTALSPLRDVVDEHLARNRFGALSAMAFGSVGLLLAAVGTFAVLSLLVVQRTREIGIRVALGAAPRRVRTLVIRDAMLPAAAGCLAGALLASWMSRALAGLLYNVTPNDSPTFLLTAGMLLLIALLASWLPARRAMRVDPVTALRSE